MKQLLDTIEAIRKEPEHVRMRYVVLSVAVSMGLILILWSFSVYEGIRSVTRTPISIPNINLPKAPSLNDPTGGTKATPTGQDFFQSEQTKKAIDSDAVSQ